jgi:hypothetical protein
MRYKQYAMNFIYGLIVDRIDSYDYGSVVTLRVVGYSKDAVDTAKETPIGYTMDVDVSRFISDYVLIKE